MSLEKKLQQAYTHGLEDGQSFILQAIRETKGIGPTLEARIIEKAKQIALKKLQG